MNQTTDKTSLIELIRAKGPFAHLSVEQLEQVLDSAQIEESNAGDLLINQGDNDRDYLLLLDGELEVVRKFPGADGEIERHIGMTKAGDGVGEISLLTSLPRTATVRASKPSRIIRIDGDRMDELLAWSEEFAADLTATAEDRRKLNLLHQAKGFSKLPLHTIQAAYKRMQQRKVAIEETVVTQGEAGDRYYIMEEGSAEVWRNDPITDETSCVAILGPGDTFGEEALLLGGYRNATIKMLSAGSLLYLTKADFDELIKGQLLYEIDAEEARNQVNAGKAHWIDCRYEMEYDESHIPDTQLIPLDQIREGAATLDKGRTYIVYCRSGRRSGCATFLLRERGFDAYSMKGGVRDWPYELEGESIESA